MTGGHFVWLPRQHSILKKDFFIPLAYEVRMPNGYIVFVHSICQFVCPSIRPSVCPDVIPSVNPFYNQVLLRSFLITYNSAATDQKLFIFGIGVPGRVLFHSTSMRPRPRACLEVKI